MKKLVRATAAALAITLAAPPSLAIAPVIALLAKQMLKDMFTTTAKGMLIDSLSGLGCKGQAIANAITTMGNVGSARGLPGGMPPGMAGMPMTPGGAAMTPEMAAAMARMMPPGGMPPGMALTPEQQAMMAQAMSAMNAPLSPLETVATIDEMSELGLMSKAMNAELKECMLLMPGTVPALGMAMGMMKPVLPKLREAREQMRALSPEDQDELAAMLGQELDKASPADRKLMLGEAGGGLFPPRVVAALMRRHDMR